MYLKRVVVYDSKPYVQEFLSKVDGYDRLDWLYLETRLDYNTAQIAASSKVICIFVNDRADKEVIKRLKEVGVEYIALRCAGYNNVDLDAARQYGIRVTRVPAYSPHAVAEHTIGLLLAINRKIHRAYNRVRELNFSLNGLMGFDIAGKTAGIIGTGKIGKVVAEILRGFSANVVAYDPYPDKAWAERIGVEYLENLEDLFRISDIISLHLPLTPQTHHLLNAEAFEKMKDGVYIINTSRGRLINTKDLIEALKSGKVGAVGLDVYEEEEGIFYEDLSDKVLGDDDLARLLTFPNCLITAHQAFFTKEALTEISNITVGNILNYYAGKEFIEATVLV